MGSLIVNLGFKGAGGSNIGGVSAAPATTGPPEGDNGNDVDPDDKGKGVKPSQESEAERVSEEYGTFHSSPPILSNVVDSSSES